MINPVSRQMKRDTDRMFQRLRDRVYTTSGMYISESRREAFLRAAQDRISVLKLKDWTQYVEYLFTAPQAEIMELLKVLAEKTARFYRDADQYIAFETQVLPEIISRSDRKKNKSLHIWSAAAGRGEEPYTIAMVVRNVLGDDFNNWKVEILASDKDDAKIKDIERAEYPFSSVTDIPLEFRLNFMDQESDKVTMHEEIRSMVKATVLDLTDTDHTDKVCRMDAIFCRNVLSFFDTATKKKVVEALNNIILPGGYLFVGQYESLHGIAKSYRLIHLLKALAYQKQGNNKSEPV